MANFEIKVEGLSDLEDRLRNFGPRIVRNGLRSANFAAAKVFLAAAKQTVPVRTGFLYADLATFRRTAPDFTVKHAVGVRGVRLKYGNTRENRRLKRVGKKYQANGPAFYGKFVEFGTSKMRAHPFLRLAFLANIDAAIEADRLRLGKAADLAARKYG